MRSVREEQGAVVHRQAFAKKSPEVYYNVMSFPTTVSEADALSMPTDPDALTMTDAFAFLSELNDKSGWQNIAKLA